MPMFWNLQRCGLGDSANPAGNRSGSGQLEPFSGFTINAAGSAIVNAVGPIRQIVRSDAKAERPYLEIVSGTTDKPGAPVQVQVQ